MLDPALRYFTEVVDCGSIRLAADRLQIAPSAISRQIQLLEHRFGAPLLLRSRTGIEATEQGKLVARYVQCAKRDLDRLKSAIDDLSGLRRGRVTLATVEATQGRVLPVCISAFRAKFPGVDLEVRILGTHQVAEAILKEEADIGIALDPPLRNELLLRMRWPQPLQAVMQPSHELAQRSGGLRLKDVLECPHILPDRSFGIRSLIERAAGKVGAVTRPFLETNSLDVAKTIAASTNALTVLPPEALFRELAAGSLMTRKIDDALLVKATIDVITLRTKPLSKAAETLLRFVRQSIADHKV
ncbi:LysR family transcriptional regulator [uncultured Bradyrhizobium sp.]|uniref:LysR family transcriptional regulator n=1 Tax=Bradyrhizobium sp. TaxID=376 RepID=UPI002606D24F|nr:LysR family transcriptional regulator [uncultured Bradyrhizobium sp.]